MSNQPPKVSPLPTVTTPVRRYHDDARFHHLVDMLEGYLHMAIFSPSDLREAAVLASTHYQLRQAPDAFVVVGDALAPRNMVASDRPQGPPPVVLVDGLPYVPQEQERRPQSYAEKMSQLARLCSTDPKAMDEILDHKS